MVRGEREDFVLCYSASDSFVFGVGAVHVKDFASGSFFLGKTTLH
jgi:hypothetical protein